jgi:hypothetical protein
MSKDNEIGPNHVHRDISNRGHAEINREVDRLVSGDLDDTRRAAVLTWLEADVRRWRRCGMAFLEAQTLRECHASVAGVVEDGASTRSHTENMPSAVSHVTPDIESDSTRARRHLVFSVAAASLLAFAVGWVAGVRSDVAAGLAPSARNGQQPVKPVGDPQLDVVDNAGHRASDAGVVVDNDDGRETGAEQDVALLRLRTGTGQTMREFVVPMRNVAGAERKVPFRHPELPAYVRSQWERKGYRVTEQHGLVPLKLSDGRRVVVPLAQYTLTPVQRKSL